MSERYPVGTKVQVKNGGQGSAFRKEGEYAGKFAGTVIAASGPDYTGIPEVCVQSETGTRRVILVGDLEEVPEPTVTEYSVKIWYRSGAYEGVPHCPENLARKVFADAVKSAGVELAELHGPSGKLVESKTPGDPVADYCGERETDTGYNYGCTLRGAHDTHQAKTPTGTVVRQWSNTPSEEQHVSQDPEYPNAPDDNPFLPPIVPDEPQPAPAPEPTA